jgi:hypothetical protein
LEECNPCIVPTIPSQENLIGSKPESMMHFKKFILIYSCMLFIASCTENKTTDALPNPIASGTSKDMREVEIHLGNAPGEETFRTNCLTCHSLSYIKMQPLFPRKTWEKIVDKMIKNFGAPISDSSAKAIVNYLMVVKGK